jgi:hypothetical protein
MTDGITAGSILIDEGAHVPGSLQPRNEPDSNGWGLVQSAHAAFENEVQEAGWTFFYMAGEIKATVFGFDKEKSLSAALKRLIANVKSQHCNSIEITRVTDRSFLKLPYVSVYAHPRHLQRGLSFSGRQNPSGG